ncbi:hypothetical protein [Haloferula sp. BvORR071]|uniref:hypothetical protein n=1 Tax=Haloferula sp. BvORR071 TaxID=1396141 RepID=UPI0005513772|nr:hypothetical protein [Haloferula sp. BvORR071]
MKITTLLVALATCAGLSSARATTTFSFITDTWTNGATTQVGFKNGATSGTLTKDGITLSFQSSIVGTADPSTRNLTLDTTGNPRGFILGTQDDANDLNGTLLNYQRWDFSFSSPVTLTTLGLDDVDSDQADISGTHGFRDAMAAEAFASQLPGLIGSGLDAIFVFTPGTALSGGVIGTGNGQSIPYAISGPAGNPNNAPAYRTYIDFGNTPISSFSIYAFSDRDNAHRVSIFQGTLEISPSTPLPEPGSALLALAALPLLGRRRRK